MEKRPEDPEAGMSHALKEALDAVERMGRAAARRNAALESKKKDGKTKDRSGKDGEGGDNQTRDLPALPPLPTA